MEREGRVREKEGERKDPRGGKERHPRPLRVGSYVSLPRYL